MALAKTTSIDVVDDWQQVVGGNFDVGNAKDISDSYDTLLFIEVALTSISAQSGCVVIVEISYGDDDWVEFTRFTGTAETPATTTINDASVNAGDTTITLTDATTGDFDEDGRKWFIKDGTVANSESVRTVVNAGHQVTIAQDLMRSHADGLDVYDRVDEWIVKLPFAAAYVRTLINNQDADAGVHYTTRVSKVTALS